MTAVEKESALAKLDPATRGEVVVEVLATIQGSFEIWDKMVNEPVAFRKVAERFGVPYLLLRFALDEATGTPEHNWSANPADALQYAEWIGQHGKGG